MFDPLHLVTIVTSIIIIIINYCYDGLSEYHFVVVFFQKQKESITNVFKQNFTDHNYFI